MASPKRVILGLRQMPPAERRVSLEAAVLSPVIHLGVRVVGLARVMRWTARGNAADETASLDAVIALTRTVVRAATHSVGGTTCLTSSLALQCMLRRRGIATQLRVGVRLTNRRLEAHAWLEYRGERINDQLGAMEGFFAFDEPVRAMRHTAT
jgi:hypothetical protein